MNTLDEIKRLYYDTTRTTVARDLTRAVALLKTLPTEEERERAAVYMDGLSQMRSEWSGISGNRGIGISGNRDVGKSGRRDTARTGGRPSGKSARKPAKPKER